MTDPDTHRRRQRPLLTAGAAVVLLLGSLLLGASGIGLPDLGTAAGRAILQLRLYRLLTGFMVGAALAGAGVVLQALLRNPLAEPFVLGVSSGAGLGAAAAIVSGLAAAGAVALPLSAFAVAAATLALVYALAHAGGRLSIYSLILSGVIVSSVCSSLLMFVIYLAPVDGLHGVVWWMLGNLQGASRPVLGVAALLIAAGLAGILSLARELNALALGEDMAHNVGVRTGLAIGAGLLFATLVTATAVSVAGLIGFVGLIVPHAMRQWLGSDHRTLTPSAIVAGGVFLVLCDALGRTVLAPREIPVGVITALIGGPFFIYVLRRRRRMGWIE